MGLVPSLVLPGPNIAQEARPFGVAPALRAEIIVAARTITTERSMRDSVRALRWMVTMMPAARIALASCRTQQRTELQWRQ